MISICNRTFLCPYHVENPPEDLEGWGQCLKADEDDKYARHPRLGDCCGHHSDDECYHAHEPGDPDFWHGAEHYILFPCGETKECDCDGGAGDYEYDVRFR